MEYGIDVSIVAVNYNGAADTRAMIDSIRGNISGVTYEIIVVDNGSRNDEASVLRNEYSEVVFIRSDKNLGFAGGNNIGIRAAKGKYLFFLNNDAYVEDDCLQRMVDVMERNPNIGLLSPKIKFASEPHLIQFAGFTPLTRITMRNCLIGYAQQDNGQYDKAVEVPYGHGAAMMTKREVIDKAGVMPEIFFLYYEELDWSEAIKDCGYEIWYEPSCTVYHRDGQTTGSTPLRTFYLTRNRLLLAWRRRKGLDRLLSIIYQTVVAVPKNAIMYFIKREFALASAVVRGMFAFFCIKEKQA